MCLSPTGRSAWAAAALSRSQEEASVARERARPRRPQETRLEPRRRPQPPPSRSNDWRREPPRSWRGGGRFSNGGADPEPEPEEYASQESYSASWADEVTPVTAPVFRTASQRGTTNGQVSPAVDSGRQRERTPPQSDGGERRSGPRGREDPRRAGPGVRRPPGRRRSSGSDRSGDSGGELPRTQVSHRRGRGGG